MNTKVVVLADETTKAVVNVSDNNPEYGYIRVKQTRILADEKSGFLRAKTITALMPGLIDDLKACEFHEGQVISGKIVIEESLTPFNKKNPERDLKIAGKTGIVCRQDGQPIYRRTRFSFNESAADTYVEHTNSEELKAAYDMEQNSTAMRPNEDFSIEG
jgi:hypothetical protein